MPPPEVSAITVTYRTLSDPIELVGEVRAFRSVDVRAQVSGLVLQRAFQEGIQVGPGTVLYRIDPRTYEAAYRSALARLAQAEARRANAESQLRRLRPLLADNAVAKQDVDDAETELKASRAAVEEARAAVDQARKDLDDTVVRAEIAGRVGHAIIDRGARVAALADVLTAIDVVDPIYVSFRPSAQQRLEWLRDPTTANALRPGGSARIRLALPDGSRYPIVGRIDFINPVVDSTTGTQEFRARFENPGHMLVPGQFVRVSLEGIARERAILVPQRAVIQQMGKQVVYVLAAGDTVVARDVEGSAWIGDEWLIRDGLKSGERIVVDGVQKVRPGVVVRARIGKG